MCATQRPALLQISHFLDINANLCGVHIQHKTGISDRNIQLHSSSWKKESQGVLTTVLSSFPLPEERKYISLKVKVAAWFVAAGISFRLLLVSSGVSVVTESLQCYFCAVSVV